MNKILTVLGARPQFIKASVVSHAMLCTENLQGPGVGPYGFDDAPARIGQRLCMDLCS